MRIPEVKDLGLVTESTSTKDERDAATIAATIAATVIPAQVGTSVSGVTTNLMGGDDGKVALGEQASTTASSVTSNSDIMDIEEAEGSGLYFDSELQSRSSFSAKSVINDSGHLDHDKMLSWALPVVNTSNLRKLASTSFPGMVGAFNMDGGSRFIHERPTSTPVAHVSNNITNRRAKKAKRQSEKITTVEERWNILQMLNDFQGEDKPA